MPKQVMREHKRKLINKDNLSLERLLDLDDCWQEPPPHDDIWIGVKGDKTYMINTRTEGDYYNQKLCIINILEMQQSAEEAKK